MIHVIMDDGELVGVVANLDDYAVELARTALYREYRRLVDSVAPESLEECICNSLDIPFDKSIVDWRDVLMAYLKSMGGTVVEYNEWEAMPPQKKGGA